MWRLFLGFLNIYFFFYFIYHLIYPFPATESVAWSYAFLGLVVFGINSLKFIVKKN